MSAKPDGDVEVLTPCLPTGVGGAGFAEYGDPSRPGCCLWCGDKLGKNNFNNDVSNKKGDYADNAFCVLRCGYLFGIQMAIFGRRLKYSPPVPVLVHSAEPVESA